MTATSSTKPNRARVLMNFQVALSSATLILAVGLFPSEVSAQRGTPADAASAPTAAARVTVMLVSSLPKSGAVVGVVRRGGAPPNDVFLVTNQTSARDLAQAVRAFSQLRRRTGDAVSGEMRSYFDPVSEQVQFSATELGASSQTLGELSRATRVEIEKIGVGRSTTMLIPALPRSLAR